MRKQTLVFSTFEFALSYIAVSIMPVWKIVATSYDPCYSKRSEELSMYYKTYQE